MSYTPLHNDLLTSTILKEGPDVVAVWVLLLASCDKHGETSMQPSAAASLLRISDERADAAFHVLSSPDLKSRNTAHDGRRIVALPNGRWHVVSHEKYQHLASRAAANERQRRYEQAKKARAETPGTCGIDGCIRPVPGGGPCKAHAAAAFADVEREPGIEG